MLRIIIFDFDGTLYNGWVWDGWQDYINKFLNSYFKTDKEKNEFLKRYVQGYEYLDERAICEGLIKQNGTAKPMLDYLENEFYPYHSPDLQYISIDFLKKLSKKYHLYIVSNTPDKSVKLHLKNNNIDEKLFKEIIYNKCDNLNATKATKFEEIRSKENAEPNEILVVGDTYSIDIEPAKRLKMNTLFVHSLQDIYNYNF